MITPTSAPVLIYTLPANADGYYVLKYDAVSKAVSACYFATGITKSLATLEGFATWAEVQARVTELSLTGMPSEDPAIQKA